MEKSHREDWHHVTEVSMVEEPIKKVSREEMATAIKSMQPEKATGASKVCADMISTSGKVRISVTLELCQRVLDGKRMSDEWQTSVQVSIFKGKGDVKSCNTCRRAKLLNHATKTVAYVNSST